MSMLTGKVVLVTIQVFDHLMHTLHHSLRVIRRCRRHFEIEIAGSGRSRGVVVSGGSGDGFWWGWVKRRGFSFGLYRNWAFGFVKTKTEQCSLACTK